MCDDHTHAEDEAAGRLSRRDFGMIMAAASLATTGLAQAATGGGLRETMVRFPAGDGEAEGFFVHPAAGRHPAVVMWPDVGGVRDAYKAMARRLAAAGYAVLVVNQYYRGLRLPVFTRFSEWRTPEGQAKLKPLTEALTPDAIARDGTAIVAWLDKQRAVDTKRGIGVTGYCQGGQFAVRHGGVAAARVKAIAAFHAGSILTEKPDSAHLLFPKLRASLLVGVAQNDHARDPANMGAIADAARTAALDAEVALYAADHGWCVLDSPAYVQAEADRAWARMLARFAKL